MTAEISPEGKKRREFLNLNLITLERLAAKAIEDQLDPNTFAVVVIDAEDPVWGSVVNEAKPDQDWSEVRKHGERPVVVGIAKAEMLAVLIKSTPNLGNSLAKRVPEGKVTALLLFQEGVSLTYVEPDFHHDLN